MAERSGATETVMAVRGPVDASELGAALVHEHVMCDFIGAGETGPSRYDVEEVVRVMRPFLDELPPRGIRTFVDCTPAYVGRDVRVLRRLSELCGLRVITNTGYYGAAKDAFVPAHAREESAEELAARWAREWREGIEGTGIRPGFIKTGVDQGGLSEIDRKLVRAAAIAHLETGLTIACHTGEATAALEAAGVVKDTGVSLDALIVVHAHAITDEAALTRLARDGAWLELDGVGPRSVDGHIELATRMVRLGFGGRILLSHDAGWYNVGQPGGGSVRPFTTISDSVLPALGRILSDRQIHELMVTNPARAFAVRVRRS